MLKSNELRMGNFIECTQLGGGIYKVVGIREEAFDVEGFPFGVLYERNDPALITPEILEQFGFVELTGFKLLKWKFDGVAAVEVKRLSHVYRFKEKYSVHFFNDGRVVFTNPHTIIKYFHQLQNIYFALTGEEITLNLPLSTPYIPQ